MKGLAEQNLTTWDRMIKSIEDSWRSMNERMEREHERTSGRVGLPQTFQNSLRSQENATARETARRIEIETQAALDASTAYATWTEKVKQLRDERMRLEAALSGATNAGDRSLLRGRITRVDEAILGADQGVQIRLEHNRQQLQFQRETEAARAGVISDPVARAKAQFDLEVLARQEQVFRDETLQKDFDAWLVARQALLNEQLKPLYQKNLEAWEDTHRSMREFHDSTMLAVQQAGDQAFRQMAVSGKFSAKAIGDAFKAELGSLVFRRLFAAPLAAGTDALLNAIGLGSGGASSAAATAATQALAAAEEGAAVGATTLGEATAAATLAMEPLDIGFGVMAGEAEVTTLALVNLAAAAEAAAVAQGAGAFALLAHEGGIVGSGNIPTRRAPASLFANAPRFHSGLAWDEFPAILQAGETVTPRGAGVGGTSVHAPVHIAIDARGSDAGVVPKIKAVLRDELPGALYQHRRALQGVLEDERRRRGRA